MRYARFTLSTRKNALPCSFQMLRGFCKFGKLSPFFICVAVQFRAMSSQQQPQLTLCKTNLRHDQNSSLYNDYAQDNVKICAPKWVEEGLEKIWPRMKGLQLVMYGECGNKQLDNKTLTDKPSLWDLQVLSRNEPVNTSGRINFANYESACKPLILSLKDLVRQCIIIGSDETTHYGGYPSHLEAIPQKAKVYICDLAGLQFQNEYNSGRLVLVGRENSFPTGELDDFIFEKVVGEKKKTFKQVESIQSERYVSKYFSRKNGEIFFDTLAYKRFVANDVVLCGISLDRLVDEESPEEMVVLKFLKYGSGFFAGQFGHIIDKHILTAVIDGLEHLFKTQEIKHIKAVEFPFYQRDPKQEARLKVLKEKYGVEYKFSNDDALKNTWPDYITATTDCADPHASMGNEMGYSSVDAAIASNLKTKGYIFSPLLNHKMATSFIDFQTTAQCHEESSVSSL